LTGYARYLDRGAKPEFFGITKTKAKLASLEEKRRRRKYVRQIFGEPFEPNAAGLSEAIERTLEKPKARASESQGVGLGYPRSSAFRRRR
jgi:hypothetical protein